MHKLDNMLIKLKIFDVDGTLSITSLMMFVLIGKVAATSTMDWTIISAMFLGLANYNGKKWFAKSKASKDLSDKARIEAVEKEVKSLTSTISLKNMAR